MKKQYREPVIPVTDEFDEYSQGSDEHSEGDEAALADAQEDQDELSEAEDAEQLEEQSDEEQEEEQDSEQSGEDEETVDTDAQHVNAASDDDEGIQLFSTSTKQSNNTSSTNNANTSSSTNATSPVDEEPPTTDFGELGIAPWLVKVCHGMGLFKPTLIQCRAIPQILAGKNVIGRAKTGSGKTAAFALPMLQELSRDPYGIFAIVLTPTRELAFQLAEQFRALGSTIPIKDVVIVGGLDMLKQSIQLNTRPHIVIATPGRLADHIRSAATPLHLKYVKYLVLDEVDRLMEDCFQPDMQSILDAIPPPSQRQTLFFSATMTLEHVLANHSDMIPNPVFVQVSTDTDALVSQLDQRYLFIPQAVKECYLVYLLTQTQYADSSIIVFISTCKGCELLETMLMELGINCCSLHAHKTQARRLASLGKFRSGHSKILLATDVASRGLDIPTVQLVINYDVPRQSADYIHRVGRTARAGRGGVAITIVSQYDIAILQTIEQQIHKQLSEFPLKEEKVLELLKQVEAGKRMARIRLEQFNVTKKVVKQHKRTFYDERVLQSEVRPDAYKKLKLANKQ